MAALFSCTKCHNRYPFDELSQGEQLCKDCRNNFPIVKCTYCRAEFQQQSKGSTNSICQKCAQNVKTFGKPSACEYCNILAAFIGNKCQRCTNSEKKWGPPSTCEQCKQRCAFKRDDDSAKKLNGRFLCWLCTVAYRRVMAKAKSKGEENRSKKSLPQISHNNSVKDPQPDAKLSHLENQLSQSESRLREAESKLERHWILDNHFKKSDSPVTASGKASHDGRSSVHKESSSDKNSQSEKPSSQEKSKEKHRFSHKHDKSKSHPKQKSDEEGSPASKKPRTEKSSTNGVSTPKSTSSILETSLMDTTGSDQMIAITQLREQLEAVKKQLQGKDQQLMEKDKKISEFKAAQYENEKRFRVKINDLQKQHSQALDTAQTKNRELQRQVAALSKGKKLTVSATSSPSIL
ncbi:protein FAM76B-like [Gigantopelta aegis]|uniref:protein FAM76B-like n=1 Tax=Gigantopelta aegis TaxID=1735272 RepID=UPI001B88B2D5|nr:protein FAM76B-like [Gigantopelta aegis]